MEYTIQLTHKAEEQLQEWSKSGEDKSEKKIGELFEELRDHPEDGTGQTERLKGDLTGYWSRRIDKKSRIVYKIDDADAKVTVISMLGHYDDK